MSYKEELKQQNIQKLQEALRVAKETEEIGAATCVTLKQQGDQIQRMSHKSDIISTNLKKSERLVRGMNGFMGRFKNWFSKAPKDVPPPVQKEPKPLDTLQFKHSESDMLDEIGYSVDSIMSMAQNIGDSLDEQNKALDELHNKADSNNQKLRSLNVKSKKLLM